MAEDPEVKGAEQKALWGLILAIASFVICNVLCIPAFILANDALRVLDRPEVHSGSRGLASAAKIVAIIGIVFLALGAVFMILWFIMLFGTMGLGTAGGGGVP